MIHDSTLLLLPLLISVKCFPTSEGFLYMMDSQGSATFLQRPLTPPEDIEVSHLDVPILHPGYKDSEENTLFTLPCLDKKAGIVGLHFGTVAILCATLSGRFDGYFTRERDSSRANESNLSSMSCSTTAYTTTTFLEFCCSPSSQTLTIGSFLTVHYHLSTTDRQLTQPSTRLALASATDITASTIVTDRDRSCRLSRDADILDKAHLSPKHKIDWFRANSMERYNQYPSDSPKAFTEDPANAIALRHDIHEGFDKQWFAIVRKEGVWTAHFVKRTVSMGGRYHNMRVDIHEGVSTQFLLARLAWTAFSLLRPFRQSVYNRYVLVRVRGDDGAYETKTEYRNLLDIDADETSVASSREGSESPSESQI